VGIQGAELIAYNTDKKHLNIVSDKARKMLLGQSITKGLGAGGFPETAQKAAELSRGDIENMLQGTDLMFLAAGMGGGPGTGASPVIADVARKQGSIVVAIVTYPFVLERARLKKAEEGINELRKYVDTIVVIDNNKLVDFVPNLPIEQAFNIADEITARAVRGIVETITTPSLINLDFSDVRTVMTNGGVSMIAVGESKGANRARDVVENTLHHKLLDVDHRGATGMMLHLTGPGDMTLGEANEVGEAITSEVDPNANVIWGARLDPTFDNKLEAFAIFTGIKAPFMVGRKPPEKEKSKGFDFEAI
jgi:cell division protein FtsZ